MIYRNKKTGMTIDTECVISGDLWEEVETEAEPEEVETEAEPEEVETEAEPEEKPKKGGKKK